jgi:AcrR family transcriptional regulator
MSTLNIELRRPHRADARRNFDALLAAARDAFAEQGSEASLEDIARRAKVGIGTLYRNFPTRQDLLNAVYLGEVEQLREAAREAGKLEPWPAWEAWLESFATYVAAKVAMQQALNKDSEMFRACRAAIVEASEPLFTRAQEAGEIRDDISFDDALRMLSGIVASAYCDDAQRDRVLRIALDGLRPSRASTGRAG